MELWLSICRLSSGEILINKSRGCQSASNIYQVLLKNSDQITSMDFYPIVINLFYKSLGWKEVDAD
jgi:ATP-dependent Clp protease adapter protein ClpS